MALVVVQRDYQPIRVGGSVDQRGKYSRDDVPACTNHGGEIHIILWEANDWQGIFKSTESEIRFPTQHSWSKTLISTLYNFFRLPEF